MAKSVSGPVPLGNVVRDYRDGDTRVIVCDDAYRDRSAEEQRKSWERLCRIASEALYNQQFLGHDKNADGK